MLQGFFPQQRQAEAQYDDIDYLLRVHDVSRLGALRFAENQSGPFLAESAHDTIPPLVSLPRLLSASKHVITEDDSDEDLRLSRRPVTGDRFTLKTKPEETIRLTSIQEH